MTEYAKHQDIITLQKTVEMLVKNPTVRIVVRVTALFNFGVPDTEEKIRSMLKNFIDANWVTSDLVRQSDTGRQRVTLTATVRVDQSMNNNLDEKAKAVTVVESDYSMEIGKPSVDNSIPYSEIAKAEVEMREALAKAAIEELEIYNQLFPVGLEKVSKYRVSSIHFSSASGNGRSNSAGSMAFDVPNFYSGSGVKGPTGPTGVPGPQGVSGDPFTNSEKYTMSATISYARIVG